MTVRSVLGGGAIAAAMMLGGLPAAAHTVTDGTSGFTEGLLHPVVVPAHLLVIVAIGLLLAQRDVASLRPAVYSLAAGLAAGLVLAGFGATVTAMPALLLATAAALGLLVALARALPDAILGPLAAVAAFGIAVDSAPESPTVWGMAAALAGTGLAVMLLVLNLVAAGHYFDRPWQKIGLRVVGSWIGASSLMVLALTLRAQVG